MKKIIILVFSGILLFLSGQAQYMVNQGADIRINTGSALVVIGDFRNQLDGSMTNSGNVIITGNWTNNATSGNLLQGTTGTVWFLGTTTQTIGGTTKTYFSRLFAGNNINLGFETSVSTELTFSNKIISLGSYNLRMETGSLMTGANSLGYVNASGSGKLFRNVGAASVGFPVGTATAYVPAALVNAGVADFFGISVFPDVRTNGLVGATIPQINDCVDMTWNISEQVAGGSNLTITTTWGAAIEGPTFDRNHCGMGHYTAGAWNSQEEVVASGANPYFISRSGITALSAFAVGDLQSPMAFPLNIRLNTYALLEGPYNGSDMNIGLNTGGYLPLSQPYNTPPWNYAGGETVLSVPANAADWVLIELRDAPNAAAATPATIIARKAGFLMKDGFIADLDGTTLPTFTATVTNQLFLVVWHRNHLGIMSAVPLVKVGGIYSYDFTSALGQAYLNGQKNLGGGNYGMFGGNASKNGAVDAADYTIWSSQVGTAGYKFGDHNMNGQVNNPDKNETWVENLGQASKVPN
jgi:hypothetical protein